MPMEERTDDLKSNFRELNERIRKLQNDLKSKRDSMGQRRVVEELSKLEQEKNELSNLFTEEQAAEFVDEESTADEFPILRELSRVYADVTERHRNQFRDVRALAIYLQYFDDEFLGLMSERKLRLDVKYSLERDSFYALFTELRRKLEEYAEEAERVKSGLYSPDYEEELMRRLVEMRHGLFISADKFFGQVNRFAGDLLDDLEQETILCQNGNEKLNYSGIDRETVLRGVTVYEALEKLYDLTDEILNYLDVPHFD